MYSRDPFDAFRRWLKPFVSFLWHGYFPVTKFVLLASVAGFFLSQSVAFVEQFSFMPERPWTFLTYILVNNHPISVFFAASWMLSVGGSLERAWLPRGFLIFFLYVVVATALSIWIGSMLIGIPIFLATLWLPIFALTVAFCMLNPDVSFFNIIPAHTAIYISFALAFFHFWPNMQAGIFGTGGCFAAYAFVRWIRVGLHQPSRVVGWRGRQIELEPRTARKRTDWNPISIFTRWKRKREFMRLLKQSGLDDREER